MLVLGNTKAGLDAVVISGTLDTSSGSRRRLLVTETVEQFETRINTQLENIQISADAGDELKDILAALNTVMQQRGGPSGNWYPVCLSFSFLSFF